MENSKDGNTVHENPKPTDQVQMEIETVTPDTEKDVVPTVENNSSPKNSDEGQEKKQEDTDQTAEVETVVPDKAKAEGTATKADESKDVAATTDDADNAQQSNDHETQLEEKELTATKTDNIEMDESESEADKKEDEGNDERDQIETVSP